jgi:hypothetical protein
LVETSRAVARETPLLLVLDDLQWADEMSLGLLAYLSAAHLSACRLLLVGTHRSEEPGKGIERADPGTGRPRGSTRGGSHRANPRLAAGVAGSFLTGDLFNLFVSFEMMLTASYVLLTLGGRREQIRLSGAQSG